MERPLYAKCLHCFATVKFGENHNCCEAQTPRPSAALDGCIADSSGVVAPKRSKAKHCWLCGYKLCGGTNYPREIDGHIRDLHKFCSERAKIEEDISSVAFGMEY